MPLLEIRVLEIGERTRENGRAENSDPFGFLGGQAKPFDFHYVKWLGEA